MNRDAKDLRELFFYAVFQYGRDVVDLRDWQLALHRAMAGHQNVVLHLAGTHIVAVHQLVEFRRQTVQKFLDRTSELLHFAYARVRRGDVASPRLDVDIDFHLAVRSEEHTS